MPEITGSVNECYGHQVSRYSDNDLELMARICFEEAGNQGFTGKRYVAAVILNQVERDDFPNTVLGVISRPGAFDTYKKLYNHPLDQESLLAVKEEIKNRSNTEIIAFRTDHFHSFLTDAFRYKDHFFSK